MRLSQPYILSILSAFCVLFICSEIHAQQELTKPEKPLTEAEIKDWFLTRIETHKMQLRYKENAAQYDDLVVAYFEGRDDWLRSEGKDPDEWDLLSERIHAVYSMMEEQKDLDREWEELEPALQEIEENPYLNAEQKEQMKSAMTQVLRKKQEANHLFVDDWPAARAFVEEYDQLDLWISGNRADPPIIK